MRPTVIAARHVSLGVAFLLLLITSGCTTTTKIIVIVVATPPIQRTPTWSAKDLVYIRLAATIDARPPDTPIPVSTPVPATLGSETTPSSSVLPPPTAARPHDVADLGYKRQLMDDCMTRIGSLSQCGCVTDTLTSLADEIGYTYQKIYESWFDLWALPPSRFKANATTLELDPCFAL